MTPSIIRLTKSVPVRKPFFYEFKMLREKVVKVASLSTDQLLSRLYTTPWRDSEMRIPFPIILPPEPKYCFMEPRVADGSWTNASVEPDYFHPI